MATAASRPRLRPIEMVVVPHAMMGRALMLRDTQGVTSQHALLPSELIPIVARFTGSSTCEEIARAVSKELGEEVPVELVVAIASELEAALFIDGAAYRRERARIEREFATSAVRDASHAGGAYHSNAKKLAEYLDLDCLATATPKKNGHGRLVGLVAPHIDPWRGARCYGEAYSALDGSLPDDVDTFVLFGTSHAPMREPFSLCRKAFATPLGTVEAHVDAIDELARASEFDPYADQFNHKQEHSLEFQAVFLKHLLDRAGNGKKGRRPVRIIPILAGLGEHQARGTSPTANRRVERFLEAVRRVVSDTNAIVVAGADLAHVGPRFGDPRAFNASERRGLAERDRESLDHAENLEPESFWDHVSADLDTRRVCGLAPIYALLRSISPKARGHTRHYEQTIDPDEGSIVSHAAVGFYE